MCAPEVPSTRLFPVSHGTARLWSPCIHLFSGEVKYLLLSTYFKLGRNMECFGNSYSSFQPLADFQLRDPTLCPQLGNDV